MGLADFFAQAGAGTGIGNIAQAFGGRTAGQAAMEDFVNNQLPQLYDQAKSATTPDTMHQFLLNFTAKSAQAGLNPDAALKLGKELMVPLMQNMQADAIDKVKNDYAPRTTATVPVDYGQPGQVRGPDVTTPGKPYDLQGAFGLVSGLTRAGAPMQPAGIQQTLETPGNIDYKAAQTAQEQQKTSQAQTTEAARQQALSKLSDTPFAGTSLSERGLGTLAPTGLTQLLPQRADPLDEARKALIASEIAKNQQQGGAAAREGHGSQMMQDFIRSGGDPNDRQGFIDFSTGVVGAKQPPAKPETDIQLRTAYEKAAIDREKLRRGMLNPVGWAEGQTEGYNAADAQFKALEAEMQNRGLLPTTDQPLPTPKPTGRGGPPRPPPGGAAAAAGGTGKQLDAKTAASYLQAAGGDKDKARQMAARDGYRF